MDELLTFMEEDWQSDGEPEDDPRIPDPSCRRMTASPLKSHNNFSQTASSSSSSQAKKNTTELTFKDVFGSPDKRDVKELGLAPTSSSASSSSKISKKLDLGASPITSISSRLSDSKIGSPFLSSPSSLSSSQFKLQKAIRQDKNVPYKPDSTQVVIDPYSRVRILKSSISIYFDDSMTAEAVLKERNIGMEYVSLSTFSVWYRGKGKDCKNFWLSGVLTRKTNGVRKSAKGNDYCIWEVNCLKDLDKKLTVFLFGSSSSSSALIAMPVGSLIDITTPSVMQDASTGATKFSINNANQVRFIGTSKDFGYCQATKKDGNKCTAVVNTWECSFCIHHASSELKKLNIGLGKGKGGGGRGKNKNTGLFPNKSFNHGGEGGHQSQESLKQQGIMIADFGRPAPTAQTWQSPSTHKTFGSSPSVQTAISRPTYSSRMSLQGPTNEMKKNPLKFGNPDTVTFVKNEGNHPLLKKEPVPVVPRKPLDLNPLRTRHLTDKDRQLLLLLDGAESKTTKESPEQSEGKKSKGAPTASKTAPVSELITNTIVSNPSAATRNFMQFLTLQHAPKDQVDLTSNKKSSKLETLIMTREKVNSMQKALQFVKQNGPLKKSDPNAVVSSSKKRKLNQISEDNEGKISSSQPGPSAKKRSNTKIDVEFDFESEDFKKILNAKSAHDDELDAIQHEEYFSKLEKKEALENKLLSTFSIETNAVMCRQCKYVALSQSEFCKENMHEVRLVKARKRFFKCKNCGNRAMSLDRLPKRPCSNCNNSSWLVAPVGKERKGPTLPSEMLAVRGNEEKFIGSAGSKQFLHLEV